MKYISTRGDKKEVTGSQAIIQGLADDRGLFVPKEIPKFSFSLESLIGKSYKDVAVLVLKEFLTDFTDEEIEACASAAYDEKFDTPEIAPLVRIPQGGNLGDVYFLELYHGKTAAFKDMALSILPHLLMTALAKEGVDKKIAILTATSGDTGKAALEGFADVKGTEIFVFYPKDGVSEIQRRQMITQTGANVHVFGIDGNFDDAQTAVKDVFNDVSLGERLASEGVLLSSANSINIGRLVPQVAYYVKAYVDILASGVLDEGEHINVCVPTGNFGNILAAYYAQQMGLPIEKLICASNENKVLTDFINTGVYDARREFFITSSPSMDILISSNLERLLYHLSGGDTSEVASLMKSLDESRYYDVSGTAIREGLSGFYGGCSDMPLTHIRLKDLFEKEDYLVDTHTAVAYSVHADYVQNVVDFDYNKTVIASTASAYKFAGSVAAAIGLPDFDNDFDYLSALNAWTGVPVPLGLVGLDRKPLLHDESIEKSAIKETIERILLK
ncbi:MAG: threonine synthase [Clostridiales Family XIII bacterium]|jgi:threonine synthase|nr:threonine synthase [Clostridiales Family XIII bacterium]